MIYRVTPGFLTKLISIPDPTVGFGLLQSVPGP